MIYYAMFDEDFDFGIMMEGQFLDFANSRDRFSGSTVQDAIEYFTYVEGNKVIKITNDVTVGSTIYRVTTFPDSLVNNIFVKTAENAYRNPLSYFQDLCEDNPSLCGKVFGNANYVVKNLAEGIYLLAHFDNVVGLEVFE